MNKLGQRKLLILCALISLFCVAGAVWLLIAQEENQEVYLPCDAFFTGTATACAGTGTAGWYGGDFWAGCDAAGCFAWRECYQADGSSEVIECEGDYMAEADQAGVTCRDSGSDSGTTIYCQW